MPTGTTETPWSPRSPGPQDSPRVDAARLPDPDFDPRFASSSQHDPLQAAAVVDGSGDRRSFEAKAMGRVFATLLWPVALSDCRVTHRINCHVILRVIWHVERGEISRGLALQISGSLQGVASIECTGQQCCDEHGKCLKSREHPCILPRIRKHTKHHHSPTIHSRTSQDPRREVSAPEVVYCHVTPNGGQAARSLPAASVSTSRGSPLRPRAFLS